MKEENIITKASEIFLNYGIKSLTMSDMASKLGISTKTLYSYVQDKNDLVLKCMQSKIDENECEISQACSSASNAIEELIGFSKVASEKMKSIQPSIFYEMKRYHSEAWDLLQTFENETIFNLTKKNLQRGINEGIYRKSMNIDVIAYLYLSIIQGIFQNTISRHVELSITEYYMEIFNYHIRGIANEKGIHLINQYLSENS